MDSETVFMVIRYENIKKEQPLNIEYILKNKDNAIEKAYDLATKFYGKEYISDFNKEKPSIYITQNFWNIKTIVQYSDWCIDLEGNMENLVFAVIETKLPKFNL
jgi:hypothetical protein